MELLGFERQLHRFKEKLHDFEKQLRRFKELLHTLENVLHLVKLNCIAKKGFARLRDN